MRNRTNTLTYGTSGDERRTCAKRSYLPSRATVKPVISRRAIKIWSSYHKGTYGSASARCRWSCAYQCCLVSRSGAVRARSMSASAPRAAEPAAVRPVWGYRATVEHIVKNVGSLDAHPREAVHLESAGLDVSIERAPVVTAQVYGNPDVFQLMPHNGGKTDAKGIARGFIDDPGRMIGGIACPAQQRPGLFRIIGDRGECSSARPVFGWQQRLRGPGRAAQDVPDDRLAIDGMGNGPSNESLPGHGVFKAESEIREIRAGRSLNLQRPVPVPGSRRVPEASRSGSCRFPRPSV